MRFNQGQSYQWASQPKRFPGQVMDCSVDKRMLRFDAHTSQNKTVTTRAGFWGELLSSLQSVRHLLQQPQNF